MIEVLSTALEFSLGSLKLMGEYFVNSIIMALRFLSVTIGRLVSHVESLGINKAD